MASRRYPKRGGVCVLFEFLPISWNVIVKPGAGAAIWDHEGAAVVC